VRWLVVLGLVAGCGNDTASPDAEHYSGSGSIVVRSYASEPGVGAGTSADAIFIAREDCATVRIGPCSIRACQPDWLGLAVSAGTLTIDSTPPFPLFAIDERSSVFYGGNGNVVALHAGETRTLAASGAAVPAFSTTFVVPDAAVITSPSAGITVGTDDVQLAWTGGSGFVDVVLQATLRHARCRFDASTGAGAIPNAALAQFREPGARFLRVTSNEVATNVPDWTITTTGSLDATWPDGTAATGTLSFLAP
jgi:hypothetical protein